MLNSTGTYGNGLGRRILATCIGLTLPWAFGLGSSRADDPPPAAERRAPQRVVVIELTGEISGLSEQYLYRKLEAAAQLEPDVLVLEIDSPGGEVTATLNMAQRLQDVTWARTVAYVPREALSGGAIVALGCDEIVMAPNALLGDAGPIFLDDNFLFQHASEKFRSHLVEQIRGLARAKGRPPALAEAMVDMSVVVFEVVHRQTGERTFMSQAELDASPDPQNWERLNPVFESRADHFLEVNGTRAVELRLAAATVLSREALRQRYQPVEAWTELTWTGYDTTILILNHPLVTALLFIVGLIALYVELASPGLGLGGIIALICFTVFFWSRFLGGTAGWLEVLLFAAGISLLMIEIFVLPGFGIWGASGILLIITALVLAGQSFLVPQTRQDLQILTRSLGITVASMLAFVAAAGVMARRLGSIPILRNVVLQPPGMSEVVATAPGGGPVTEALVDGQWIRVGDRGQTASPLRPAGRIRIRELYLDVVSDGTFVDSGTWVQVIDVRGNRIVVRQVAG